MPCAAGDSDYLMEKIKKIAAEKNIRPDEAMSFECANISQYAERGAKLYHAEQYSSARKEFLAQAILLDYCERDIDKYQEHKFVVAYNNVAMTYVKEKNYALARVWMSAIPDAPESRYNLNLIKPYLDAMPDRIEGKYTRYIGQGNFDWIFVSKGKQSYDVHAFFLYSGPGGFFGVSRDAQFMVSMPLKKRATIYRDASGYPEGAYCEVSIRFSKNAAIVKTLRDEQNACSIIPAKDEFYRVED